MQCTVCYEFKGVGDMPERNMLDLPYGIRRTVDQTVAWSDLTESAASCYICDILVRGCRGCFRLHDVQEDHILSCDISFQYQNYPTELADGDNEIRFKLRDGRSFEVQIFATENEEECIIPDSWEYFPVYKRVSSWTSADKALSIARSWLDECASGSHEFCDAPHVTQLPKRVIDVGANDESIRLIEPEEGQVGSYVCLSHCWGQVQIMTSTRQTLGDRMSRIAVQDLFSTFRDAITFTRRLGIQYIWIDSLCIIQDDPQDWNVESAKMNHIYSNSYLTIAATFAHDGDGGLFSHGPDVDIRGLTPAGQPYRLFFREKIDHHLDVSYPVELKGVHAVGHPTSTYYPLLTRAWVYQERLLSTRVLHFGRYELFFECRSTVDCECGGISQHGSSSAVPLPVTKLLHAHALDSVMVGHDWHVYAHYYIARLWRTMVTSYTCLSITKTEDRLPAIGGLAKHMASRRKTDYLAGLWRDTLNDDLLWAVYNPEKTPRPSSRTAPTWSWASVDNHVRYGDEIIFWDPDIDLEDEEQEPFQHFAKVEDCTVTVAAVDEFGEIAKGRLQLTGLLAAGELERDVRNSDGKAAIINYYVVFPGGIRLPMKADYLLDAPGPDQVLLGTKVHCLRMSQIENGIMQYLVSLVLRQTGSNPPTYTRIGIIFSEAMKPASVDPLGGGVYARALETTVTII